MRTSLLIKGRFEPNFFLKVVLVELYDRNIPLPQSNEAWRKIFTDFSLKHDAGLFKLCRRAVNGARQKALADTFMLGFNQLITEGYIFLTGPNRLEYEPIMIEVCRNEIDPLEEPSLKRITPFVKDIIYFAQNCSLS